MLEVLGKEYYIDVDKIIDECRYVEEVTKEKGKKDDDEAKLELNVFKYEIFKLCLDRILNEFNDDESDIAAFTNKHTDTSFGIAFNTLLKNNIIKENE